MENRIKQYAETLPGKKQHNRDALSLIRYADDFVILHENLTVVQRCQQIISEWLKDMGLELKPSKTRITNTLSREGEQAPGFDFLGFAIRQHSVGKYQTGKNGQGKPLGFKTIITPSKEGLTRHIERVGKVIETHKASPQWALIKRLNPIIMGWANYYSTQVSKEAYSKTDHYIYQQLRAWANHRHPNKNKGWVVNKYWHTIENRTWVFATRISGKNQLMRLIPHSETPIVRHVKVQGERSPYDGDWVYWSTRLGKHPEISNRTAKLLKSQKGKCAYCGLYFKDGDSIETDHKIPKAKGGKDTLDNLQLLHRHCHDNKTALDGVVGIKVLDEDWLDANPF